MIGQSPIERYGMTETLITVSTRADGERRPGWVGQPIVGVDSRLVDESGDVIDHDGETIGELQIRGATMFDEYLNRPDATTASFDGDWFRTGDAAVIDAGGFHRIVGRQSVDIIKTGGFKVGAGEVEAALLTHPGVTEAAVVGVSDPDLGQRIVAYVVVRRCRRRSADRPRRRAAVGAQASTRGPRRRRVAAQRHGQGPKDAAHLSGRRAR